MRRLLLLAEMTQTAQRTGHFGDEECADFARGRGDARRRKTHLQGGCEKCARRLRLWETISRVAEREVRYAPPDAVVRQVRGQFALHKPASFLERTARAASLLFDSFSAPLAHGVRAGATPSRLLLYGKGGRLLKLRVENRGLTEALSLVGQVVEESDPKRKMPNLPVLVQNGSKTVNQTLTNQSGEFAMELEPASSLRLVVGVPGPEALMVMLPIAAAVEDD
jgi:hypothetical protein